MQCIPSRFQTAFSLVELSIVLVILGLLTGGILSGQSLIRASELRSVTADLQRFQGAINTFRDKYNALPGDMTNATAFWGAQDGSTGTTPACYTTLSTTTATCNGDGDGYWREESPAAYAESYRAWQHLANAGLIEGSYTGVMVLNTHPPSRGVNAPASKITNAGYGLFYATAGDYALIGNEPVGNKLSFGTMAPTGDMFRAAVLKPEEAWNIDTKLDDGLPASGKILIDALNPVACYTGVLPNITYNLVDTGLDCSLRLSL